MPNPSEADEAAIAGAVAVFSRDHSRHEKLASYVCGLIRDHCGGALIHTTESRAKAVESFEKKCRKLDDDGNLRYTDPLKQITDASGVRVIVFLRDSVDVVCGEIEKLFEVVEREDVGERVYRSGKFGYQSKHLLIRLGADRKGLVENAAIVDMICEVQVRTLLQHAWAEMEHDIQYKSDIDIPLDLNKRFSALAGLLEIADREFASIQQDSEALKLAIREDLITDLTQQSLNEGQENKSGDNIDSPAIDARNLVSMGKYSEAIEIYSKKIEIEPNSYTLFIGRARARFLAGDVRGAVADLDHADDSGADSGSTARLRGIIERGDDPRKAVPSQTSPKFAAERNSADESMRQGDGVRAFDEYSRLESAGYNKAYTLFGKAMSCALERDIQGARNFLESLQIRPGTPMAVNIYALDCIIDILEDEELIINLAGLDQALEESPQFELKLSSLNDLRSGLQIKAFAEQEKIEAIFARIANR